MLCPVSLARISHHELGRAGLWPRCHKAFPIILRSRAARSPSPDGLRAARDRQTEGGTITAGLNRLRKNPWFFFSGFLLG